ncbi:uncharacterized protein LOC108030720 isoform X2 [Drosophila biarmipes]|nr:uncharacterized protein LOC108030720 isoform X2 [Drosophila biarmipes]
MTAEGPESDNPLPPPNSSGLVNIRRLPIKYMKNQEPLVRRSESKPSGDREVPPIMVPESLNDHKKHNYINHPDSYDSDLPTSDDIWQTFKEIGEGLVPSEADWPLRCRETNAAEGLFNGEKDSKCINDSKHRRIFSDAEIAFNHINIGEEEDRALDDWIQLEGLNEPQSDIEEFDKLLSLARDLEKNRDVLFDMLKPKNLPTTQAKLNELPCKLYAVEPQCRTRAPDEMMLEAISEDDVPEINIVELFKEMELHGLRPERPVILDVRDIGSVPAKPEDEAAIQDWLQQCSGSISHQLQFPINEQSGKPTSTDPGAIDFESEIDKEQTKARTSGRSIRCSPPENEWQNSFAVRLGDFEDIIDQSMTEYRDPQAKKPRSKWNHQYGFKSTERLARSLVLPPLPAHIEQCLQKIRILRRPTKRQSEFPSLPVGMKFCKLFCTLQLNTNLDLDMAAKTLDNAIYNRDVGVIEVRYEATQIGWIWANGTVMILNGRSNAMLAETQCDIVAKIMGRENFKADPSHKLLHLRLFSVANYPWGVNLDKFSELHCLSSEPFLREMKFCYYVNKNVPGVAARLYESGIVQVFAMTTAEADEMLKKVYLLSASYRMPELKNKTKYNRVQKLK